MKKVGENDRCVFYQSAMSDSLGHLAAERGLGLTCLVAEQKDGGAREYVLVEGGEVAYANSSAEAVACRVDAMSMSLDLEERRGKGEKK